VSVRGQGGLWGQRARGDSGRNESGIRFQAEGDVLYWWVGRVREVRERETSQGVIMVKGSSLRFRHEVDGLGRVTEMKVGRGGKEVWFVRWSVTNGGQGSHSDTNSGSCEECGA
jgi:hypothetical protein